MDIAVHAIVIALILVAALVINMITGNAITSQLLVTTRATNLDQDHDHDQGPVLMILEA